MTVVSNGITIDFQDGYATKVEALKDYAERLGAVADIVDTKEGIELNYKDGRKAVITL